MRSVRDALREKLPRAKELFNVTWRPYLPSKVYSQLEETDEAKEYLAATEEGKKEMEEKGLVELELKLAELFEGCEDALIKLVERHNRVMEILAERKVMLVPSDVVGLLPVKARLAVMVFLPDARKWLATPLPGDVFQKMLAWLIFFVDCGVTLSKRPSQ